MFVSELVDSLGSRSSSLSLSLCSAYIDINTERRISSPGSPFTPYRFDNSALTGLKYSRVKTLRIATHGTQTQRQNITLKILEQVVR